MTIRDRRIYSGSPYESAAGYARAVIDGNIAYVSGTTGLDPDTGMLSESVEDQTLMAFSVISRALEQAGCSMADLMRIRVFVTSREEFDRIKPIIREQCLVAQPANTTVICDLVDERMRVEIEVTARIPDK